MILLLDTSTPLCKLSLIDNDRRFDEQWQADRELAKGLLGYLTKELQKHQWVWQDITGIGLFEGPGSFTGLRIGLTVMNTVADSQGVPIVGTRGEDWQRAALDRLSSGKDDRIVMPFYGSDAHITAPRK
jgi:tRNA threonylcarbamoyladenosine biosynthesis protein TsaB